MNAVWKLMQDGGPVMFLIVILSILLYERCCSLLFTLYLAPRRFPPGGRPENGSLKRVQRLLIELPESYRQQRGIIGVLIMASPLLGLLGTVMGMIATFNSLSAQAGARTMDGLAAGISQALITTETGLAVIIPAVLVLYSAHRQLQRNVQRLTRLEADFTEGVES